MIVQEEAQGDEVRVLVVKWEVILARNRVPASVVWDGVKNITQLIEEENINPLRGDGYNLPLANIKIDDELISFISKKWLDLNSVPKNEETVQLRWNSNTGTWWTMINVTDTIHDSTKKICVETAKSLWLEICWIDILSTDIGKPLSLTWGIILEVGATPWLWWERELTGVNTAKKIIEKVFE
jgi:cyanophycin synthetase